MSPKRKPATAQRPSSVATVFSITAMLLIVGAIVYHFQPKAGQPLSVSLPIKILQPISDGSRGEVSSPGDSKNGKNKGPAMAGSLQSDSEKFFVTRVVDGDTLVLDTGERVRLVGIDTPESSSNSKTSRDQKRSKLSVEAILKSGREAKKFTKSLVEGKRVMLQYDVQQRDKYGRLLAYVYIPMVELQDREEYRDRPELVLFLNDEIIRQGYASPMTIPPNVKYAGQFREAFREARHGERGLWRHVNDGYAQLSVLSSEE